MRAFRVMAVAAVAISLAASGADAQGNGKGKGQGQGKAKAAPKVQTSGGNVHVDGTHRGAKTPPGLAKKGGLPPGQARKYSTSDGLLVLRDVFGRNGYTIVRTASEGDLRYVYYRRDNGTVRRAIVRPGDRLTFVNVPDLVLRQVVARLY